MTNLAAMRAYVWKHVPTRDSIADYRLLRPFAHHLTQPNLWHMNHRSVPRAVALGLGVGVIVPVMHTLLVMIFAVPTRANIAIAAATTFVVNPLTMPPLYWAAYRIGKWELNRGSEVDPATTAHVTGEMARFMFWIHHASGPIALGILTIAIAASSIGYLVSGFLWKRWRMSRWHARRRARSVGQQAAN